MNRGRHSRSSGHLWRVLAGAIAALASLASSAAAQPRDRAAPVLQAIVEAEAALEANEEQLAESLYRTALLEGGLLLGALDVADGDLERARLTFETAATVAVKTRRARLSLAAIHLKTGEPVAAITLLRGIIRGNLMDAEARKLLAEALAANDQLEESVQELEEIRVLFPDDLESYYLLGAAYLSQARVEEAETVFSELAERRPIPQTWVLVGRTYRDFKHYELARRALEAALAMDPQVRRAHYYLGTIEFFEFADAGIDKAIIQFQAELLVSPEDPSTNLYLGLALVEKRRDEEAIPRLELARRHPGAERDALHFLGRAYLRAGRAEDAVAALTRALELAEGEVALEPEDLLESTLQRQISQIHYQLGLALRRTGAEAAAAPHFEAAKTSIAQDIDLSRERLRRYLEDDPGLGRLEAFSSPLESTAVTGLSFEERLDLRKRLTWRVAQAYMNLGVLQARKQEIARAADLFAKAAALEPEFPQVQYSLGVALFNVQRFDEATGPLSRSLELDPESLPIRRMLALAWLNSDRPGRAAELLADDPGRADDRSLQYAYGLALVGSGRGAEAEKVFTDLLAEFDDWPELNVVMAQAYAQRDDFNSAIASLEKALELRADVPQAHATLGEIYMRQGKLAEAERELRAELGSHPDDLKTRYMLATVLDLAGRSDEARGVLRGILDETPGYANARYLLGKILLAEGRPEEAQIQLEAAARLAPADQEIHYQLGLALQRQGRVDEAREAFATYQTLKRENG